MSSKKYYFVLLAIAAFSIWIRTGFPVSAGPYFLHDDALFIRMARYLEAGQWLGPYDNLTLAKGMFYPLFIVMAFWISVPLKIAEQVVYLAACALAAGMVRCRVGNSRLSLVLFALLAFNPVFWSPQLARVLRQAFYMSLSLAVLVLVVIIAFPNSREASHGFSRSAVRGVSLGLVGAAYWMTREEGGWLLPAFTVVLAAALIPILRPDRSPASERGAFPRPSAHLKAIVSSLVVALGVFTAADWLVAGLNHRYYGIFETSEFRSKSFLRAFGALARIQEDEWHPDITFPKDARQRAYAVSPAAGELASSFEGPTGNKWLQVTCFLGHANPCVEVETGWFLWEFRDAVADAGHYRSGKEAMRYYDELADQINSACAHGNIRCLPPRATLLPPFRWEYVGQTIKASKAVAKVAFSMEDGPVGVAPSYGPRRGIAVFADTVDGVQLPQKEQMIVRGWTAAASATPTLRLVARNSEEVESSIEITPAPDVFAILPNLKSVRFELKTDCPVAECDLILDVTGGGESRIPLVQLIHPAVNSAVIESPVLRLYVDSVAGLDNHKFSDSRRALQVKIANAIASTYGVAFPILAVFGVAGLLLATAWRRRCQIPMSLLAFGLGSAVAVGTSIVLMAYLSVIFGVSFANVTYTSQASPFVIILTIIGIYAGYATLRGGDWQVSHQGHSTFQPGVAKAEASDQTLSQAVDV
jgi:hypothetical protein